MRHDEYSPFSIQVLNALLDVLARGKDGNGNAVGKYRTGPQLENFLANVGISMSVAGSSREKATMSALIEANRKNPFLVTAIIEHVVDPREYRQEKDLGGKAVAYLNAALRPDGLELRRSGMKYKLVELARLGRATELLRDKLGSLDYDSVDAGLQEIEAAIQLKPWNATKDACVLVESVCKCILDDMGEAYPKKQDIQGLVRAVSERLNLSPGRQDIGQDVKQILGGLITVTNGIGALRTHEGAHGKGKGVRSIDGRIARLAVNAASAIVLFYIETWEKRKAKQE